MTIASDPISIKQRTCQSCGMLLNDPGEFHPHAFCVWKRAGQPPWETLNAVLKMLGRPTVQRINVRDIRPADET